ncbi:MAG: PAS domain-containing protein [Chloroflexi bacterium]|nr:PAS domain-containing protein [Chloroflexota bacterium]
MVSPKTIPKNHINDRPEDQSFRQMFDQHSAVMLLVDPQTDLILEANSAAAKFYGCPQLCGKSINEINVLPSEQVLAERQKAKAEGRNTLILSQRLASRLSKDSAKP